MTEVHTWKWWWWWSSKIARLLLAPALMIFTQFNLSQVAQLLCTLRAPLCDMLACCNIRSRDPTLHTYWWSVPGCNEMMMTTEWSLRSHWTVDSGQWSHWQYPDTADKWDHSQSGDILSVTHTEQLSPELFTSFVLLIIVRFKFFTLGKILRDIFLGHVESDCFIWTQASQNLFFPNLSLSAPIWSWWIFHSVSRAVLRTWSPESSVLLFLSLPGAWFLAGAPECDSHVLTR